MIALVFIINKVNLFFLGEVKSRLKGALHFILLQRELLIVSTVHSWLHTEPLQRPRARARLRRAPAKGGGAE